MNKKQLIDSVTERLRMEGARKPVSFLKARFHISDDDGNKKDFIVRKPARGAIYTVDDVKIIMNAIIDEIEQTLQQGEEVSIHNFGVFEVKKMAETTRINPNNGEKVIVGAHYAPKFHFGSGLRMAAKIYDMRESGTDGVDSDLLKTAIEAEDEDE